MIGHFLKLEWKQYFRSSYWQKSIALNIVLVFFALYMLVSFLLLGVGAFFFIEDQLPGQDPLKVVNSFLVFALLGDLVFRYLMQKLPVMNIKPMLTLPIKKSKLVHYVLGKSMVSFFNFMPLFFYVPFAIVLIGKDYNVAGALGWLFSMLFITQALNFINFLINKSNVAFGVIVVLLGGLIALQYYEIYDVASLGGSLFNAIYTTPLLVIIPVIAFIGLYLLNYKQLRNRVYLDDVVSAKNKRSKFCRSVLGRPIGRCGSFYKK